MPTVHEIEEGECLLSICAGNGLDWKTVYDHPENKDLKAKRPDPNFLLPGDRVFLPDPRPKVMHLETGKVHRLVVKRPLVWLKLKVFDHVEGNRSQGEYVLTVEGLKEPLTGSIGGEGVVEAKVPWNARTARLVVKKGDMVLDTFNLAIGSLAPHDIVEGVQARLNRLGFDCGEVDGEMGPRTERAIMLFRQRFSIEEDDLPGTATANKLKELAGC